MEEINLESTLVAVSLYLYFVYGITANCRLDWRPTSDTDMRKEQVGDR
jgi:hypothetical protein